jgi:hypothetical protein
VLTHKATPLRRRNRAVTLIEAVLYISIALALIVGGLVFFQQASTAARTSATVRQLSAVLAEARVYLKGVPVTAVSFDVTPILISAGAVPQDMVKSPTELTNAFGGTTRFSTVMGGFGGGAGRMINVRLTDVPQAVCVRLLTATSGTSNVMDPETGEFDGYWNGFTTIVSSEQSAAAVRLPAGVAVWRPFAMNPTQAGWMCRYGSGSYDTQDSEPATPPHSGNVAIAMNLLVDA